MKRRLALSIILSLIVSILSNVVATYLLPAFTGREWVPWVALAVTFVLSLFIQLQLAQHAEAPGGNVHEGGVQSSPEIKVVRGDYAGRDVVKGRDIHIRNE